MRRLALLALMSLAFAAPAGAQDGGRLRGVQSEPSLRGPVGETPENGARDDAESLAALVPMPPPVAPVGTVVRSDARQCRQSCNRAYYFCLSAEEDICAPAWTQCTARCGRR